MLPNILKGTGRALKELASNVSNAKDEKPWLRPWSFRVIWGPAASASPGGLLEMQSPYSSPTITNSLGVRTHSSV